MILSSTYIYSDTLIKKIHKIPGVGMLKCTSSFIKGPGVGGKMPIINIYKISTMLGGIKQGSNRQGGKQEDRFAWISPS